VLTAGRLLTAHELHCLASAVHNSDDKQVTRGTGSAQKIWYPLP